MLTHEQELEKARKTFVADLPSGATIIIAHPGQQPNMDPKFLRENFGVTPAMVITRDESREAPRVPTDDDITAVGLSVANGVSVSEHQAALDRIAELEAGSVPADEHEKALARIAELEAKKAPAAPKS